jgi:iron complex transport system substrate-binding protein
MKLMAKTIIIVLLIILTAGCGAKADKEIIDRAGRTVRITGAVNRVVSTAPSNAEIIADLGEAGRLVAVDRHSANVSGIPAGLPLLDFFYPDAEVIVKLEPDIIIANGHNPTGSGEDPFRLLEEMGIPVVYISMSKSINDIYLDIAFISRILGVDEKGRELATSMKAQIDEIAQKTANIAEKDRKNVYFEISAAPEMFTFGRDSFLNDMITVINARNIFENENWILSPSAEAVIERNPDVILTNVNYIDDPIGELKGRPGFDHINAVMRNHVYQIDTDSSVRPSARITLALRQMSRAVYPNAYETE